MIYEYRYRRAAIQDVNRSEDIVVLLASNGELVPQRRVLQNPQEIGLQEPFWGPWEDMRIENA